MHAQANRRRRFALASYCMSKIPLYALRKAS
jgi:hypothetical protein